MQKIPLAQIREAPSQRPPDTRSRWQIFSAAPHRLMFFSGFVFMLLNLIWWSLELASRQWGFAPLPSPLPVSWAHAFLMIFGLFIFFIFGFLMTTYPRWMRGEEISRRLYVPVFFLLSGGMLLIYIGLLGLRPILLLGLLVFLSGWLLGYFALLRVYFQAKISDLAYEKLFNAALFIGAVGVSFYLLGLALENWVLIHYAIEFGLWGFLVPVTLGVCHRMIPFFTTAIFKDKTVYRPQWMLPVIFCGGVGHALLSSQTWWAWRWLADLPLLVMVGMLSWHWDLRRSLQDRLLAVLHVSFFWLFIALVLYNLQSLWLLFSGEMILGKAPLHALTVGFISSLVIGMASRVTLGHSGRMLSADGLTWVVFWGMSAAAVLRISGEFPAWNGNNLWAALLWLLVVGLWVGRYLPIVLKARLDGEPG